jgi:hypothetical protein
MTSTRFKDFSKKREPVEFKIDDDLFVAPSILPIPTMQELAEVAESIKTETNNSELFKKVTGIFDAVLTDASAARFRERVASKEEPVDIEQLIDIMLWLLEEYGLRPTQPSSDSSAGAPSGTSGTLSTAGVPAAG